MTWSFLYYDKKVQIDLTQISIMISMKKAFIAVMAVDMNFFLPTINSTRAAVGQVSRMNWKMPILRKLWTKAME